MNAVTRKLLTNVIQSEQDFEWYPSTDEIIKTIYVDLYGDEEERSDQYYRQEWVSILDCGAGDGRVLKALTKGDKFAIEKSKPLLNALDKDIFVVGTEFEQQTLIDKSCNVLFSNPPYSVFEQWTLKIIKEDNCGKIYLVIPSRWKESEAIQEAIKLREGEVTVLGSFDFLNAERAARAKVDIVKINLAYSGRWNDSSQPKTCPFKVWFEENFKLAVNQTESSMYDMERRDKKKLDEEVTNELVQGDDVVVMLERLYQRDLANLMKTYQSLGDIDSSILKELGVNIEGVRGALKQKIVGLKDRYWQELFDRFDRITDRLTAASRKALLSTLTAHTHVDFTISNAHSIIVWVIKNANEYFDKQLITTMERMVEKANVVRYKSN